MSSFYFWHWRICVLMRLNKGAFACCRGLKKIYYNGAIAQWKAISKDSFWNRDTGTYEIYCTDGITNKGKEV